MDIPVIKRRRVKKGKVLGEGQYGTVYKGRLALSRNEIVRVAVKEPVDIPELIAKISEEAAVLKELEGERGVPRLYGMTNDCPPCLVMELCPGKPLQHCLRRGHVRRCLLALLQVCDIVQRLHARGITHGDIHEWNVLVNKSGDKDVRAFLVDFGLAVRDANYHHQESDLTDIVATALEVIPDTEHFSDRRWHLNLATDLDEVTALLQEVLQDDGLTVWHKTGDITAPQDIL